MAKRMLLLAFCAGILLVFAFAPSEIFPLAIICPALLLFTWLDATPKQACWRGFLFGLGFFGCGVSWIFVSIHNFGNANLFLAGLITGLFVIILALFPASQGYLLTRFFPTNSLVKLSLAFPSSWVLIEWIRSWIFTGFPWLMLGASQTNSPLRGWAPLIGEFGLSFMVAMSSALLILIYLGISRKQLLTKSAPAFGTLLLIWLSATILINMQWTTASGKPINVALVQGNIPQQIKWTQSYLVNSVQTYEQLTQHNWNKQLIVWPETAIPLLQTQAQDILAQLDKNAKQHSVALITGIPVQDGFMYYNGAIGLGTAHGLYYKRHLVPFGEYVPLLNWFGKLLGFLNIPMSDFSEGSWNQPLLQTPGANIAMYICYEIAYPDLVLSDLPAANLLIAISDDAWFGHSFAAAQHLQIGQMRALETGRYLLFASNSGITAIIDPHGKIIATVPAFESTVLTGVISAMTGATPLVRMGINIEMIIIAGLLLVTWLSEYRSSQ